MKSARNLILIIVAVITLLWLPNEAQLISSSNLFEWRSALIQYSGILSLLMMSVTMILALRLAAVETWLQGMDKAYRVHKWLGIAGVSLAITHWVWEKIPKWLVQLDLLTRPEKHAPARATSTVSDFANWIMSMKGVAKHIGEWGFYLLLALIVISLWSLVKYKAFKLSHRLMAVAYLLVTAHSILLLDRSYWSSPIYYVTIIIAIIGSVAALYSLFSLVGRRNRHLATVKNVRYFPQTQIMELSITPTTSWPNHQAGQFAYLRFGNEDPHPFTIASSGDQSELRFYIKELGDFTTGLVKQIEKGDCITIEGPYGRLGFNWQVPQIWIAGGVGISSFIAALQALQTEQRKTNIHLFYCTRGIDSELLDMIRLNALQASVTLHVIDTLCSPRLNAQHIIQTCGNLNQYQVYFCGPEIFSKTLKIELTAAQFNTQQHYHEELFVMR